MRFLLPVVLFASLSAQAQDNVYTVKDTLDGRTLKKVIGNQFTSLITGQAKNSIGNYASVDPTKPEVALAGSFIFKNYSVLTIQAKGTVTDGIYAIFNNSKLNTAIALDLHYHIFLHPKNPDPISYFAESQAEYEKKKKALYDSYSWDIMRINSGRDTFELADKKDDLGKKNEDLKLLSKSLQGRIDSNNIADAIVHKRLDSTLHRSKDSVDYQIKVNAYSIDTLQTLLKAMGDSDQRWSVRTTAYNRAKKALEPDIALYAIKLRWLSIGYKVENNDFKLFNSKASFADQVEKRSFATQEASIQYSQYFWTLKKFRTYFLQLGLGFSYTDNLGTLTKVDLTEKTNYGATADERTASKQYSVYTGTYEKDLKQLRLYGDYFRFLFENNTAAIHFNPELKIKDNSKPIYSASFGFLLLFKKTSETASAVNAELYYKCTDLFDYMETEDKLFERNEVGLRFSFPITFITKTK